MTGARTILALLLLVLCSGGARAQSCSFNVTSMVFPTIAGLTGGTVTTTGTLTATCSGSLLGYCIRPHIGAGSGGASAGVRLMASGANSIGYELFTDASLTTPWGSALDLGILGVPPFIAIPGSLSTQIVTRKIYARQTLSSPAAPGAYSSSFPGAGTVFEYGFIGVASCGIALLTLTAPPAAFTVSAEVERACEVTANDLDFGTESVLAAEATAQANISVSCTPGTDYTVGLGGGQSGATDPEAREMTLGAESVVYGLYRNSAHSSPWGDTLGSDVVEATGTGGAELHTVYGRVPPQATPTPGTYTDTVVVTVRYADP